MKKSRALALVVVLAITLLVAACAQKDTVAQLGTGDIEKVEDLFSSTPLLKVYKGGLSGDGQISIQEKLTDTRLQVASMDSELKMLEVYELEDKGLVIIGGDEVMNFQNDNSKMPKDLDAIVIKSPLKVGDVWGLEGYETELTAINKEITTPYGKLNTIELTNKGVNYTVKLYYARGLGLVSYLVDDKPFIELYSVEEFDKDIKSMSSDDLHNLYLSKIENIK